MNADGRIDAPPGAAKMTPAEIKRTKLYRTLAPCIVKKDREELARMLAMVDWQEAIDDGWDGVRGKRLFHAFNWFESPQSYDYWNLLSVRLMIAGHACF